MSMLSTSSGAFVALWHDHNISMLVYGQLQCVGSAGLSIIPFRCQKESPTHGQNSKWAVALLARPGMGQKEVRSWECCWLSISLHGTMNLIEK